MPTVLPTSGRAAVACLPPEDRLAEAGDRDVDGRADVPLVVGAGGGGPALVAAQPAAATATTSRPAAVLAERARAPSTLILFTLSLSGSAASVPTQEANDGLSHGPSDRPVHAHRGKELGVRPIVHIAALDEDLRHGCRIE